MFFFHNTCVGFSVTQRQILRSLIGVTNVSFLPNVHVAKFAFTEQCHILFFRNCNFVMKSRKAPWPLSTQNTTLLFKELYENKITQ